jgi:hypothetical protein
MTTIAGRFVRSCVYRFQQQQTGRRADQVILAPQGIDLSHRLLTHVAFFTGIQVSGFFLKSLSIGVGVGIGIGIDSDTDPDTDYNPYRDRDAFVLY